MEGEQGDHVREQREGKGEAQASRQAPVPQNPLDEGGHQVDVAWGGGDSQRDDFKSLRRLLAGCCSCVCSVLRLTDPEVNVIEEEAAQHLVQGPVHLQACGSSH